MLENIPIADKVYKLTLSGDTGAITAPGQFVNLLIPSLYLRRPISVCDWDEDSLTLIYKVVGEGTRVLSEMAAGMKLDILTGLGNGFSPLPGVSPLLVGGGVGAPPMYALAKKLRESGLDVTVLLGFGKKTDVFYLEEFASLGVRVLCATMDGSVGTKGTVIDAIRAESPAFDSLYACGPIPMLRALYDFTSCPALFSFEERMGCGFGACMGCTCHTVSGSKRICKDGPVLAREEIVWRT
ncbi:MAG: dihydroorotate dehydrogenase electron transfer subunit [Oscillospiraceae bacterium]|nr:dihydroorotate dehydrogenase electron transfer subunit [Oscillospiraceae bacterium]